MDIAKDIFNEIAERAGWPQIDAIESPTLSVRHRKMLRVINRVLKSLGSYTDWPLLRKSGTILLVASETSDTTAGSEQYCTLTQNSDVVTVANMTFTDTYIGRAVQFSGSDFPYRIIAVPAPDQIQLHRVWVDTDKVVADAVTFKIAMDQYALPDDFDRLSDKGENVFSPTTITPLDPSDFAKKRRQDPGIVLDEPAFLTIKGMNPGETHKLVHFHPFPRNARIIQFDYQREHPAITSNNDKILYAASAVEIVIDAVLEIVEGDLEADDAKVARVLERLMRNYNMRQSHQGPTAKRVELRPANDIRVRTAQWSPSVKVDWGEFWDRAEDKLS